MPKALLFLAAAVVAILNAALRTTNEDERLASVGDHRLDPVARIVGILGTVIAICALAATSCQIWTIRDNAQRQLRAYVFVRNVHIRVDDSQNNRLEIDLTVENLGSTPATDYYFWACTVLREQPVTTCLPIEPDNLKSPSKSVLAPGSIRFIHNPSLCDVPAGRPGGGIPPEERALLQNGKKAIYVLGTLHYKDAWNERLDRTPF
jgi:hypothetical protein